MEKSGLLELITAYHLYVMADKVYGPYKRDSDGRSIVIVVDDVGNKRTQSYPKWLVENHLGQSIGDLTVDHVDSNKLNDDLSNYRLLPRDEHSREDTRRVQLIDLECGECGKKFKRSPRLLRDKSKKGVRGIFCSRSCAGKNSRKRQLGLIEAPPLQPYIESTYYKQKNVAELKDYLIQKYGTHIS